MKKIIHTLAFVLMVSACGNTPKTNQEETMYVNIEKVSKDKSPLRTPYIGVIEAQQSTMVSFTGMAVLKTMTVSEGQRVKKGQLLATIDDTQAQNALTAAKSALEQALDAQTRMKQLHDNNSLPEMKWIEIESKVKQAQASYDMCKKNLEECAIYAPCDGVIGSKIMNVGETVLPSEPVLDILSINKVKVRVSVPEKEISGITKQTPSIISLDAIPEKTFKGGYIEKGVSADAITHTYDIRISLNNPDWQILPGMVAKVYLTSQQEEPRITLPIRSIQQSANKKLFVWIVKDGKAQRAFIKTGETINNRIVITEGIQENDQVITEGYQKVGEGTPVKIGE